MQGPSRLTLRILPECSFCPVWGPLQLELDQPLDSLRGHSLTSHMSVNRPVLGAGATQEDPQTFTLKMVINPGCMSEPPGPHAKLVPSESLGRAPALHIYI